MAQHSPSYIRIYVINPPVLFKSQMLKTIWKNTNAYFIVKSKSVKTITLESQHIRLERHLNASPACQPRRPCSPRRMRDALKGSTVMALTSWSYRGKSGRECGAAGSTDNERVCWSGRRSPRGRQSFVDFPRGWWRSYPPSGLGVFAAARRATCQVPGLSSNFHGCAEITKSQGPSFPFDRLEENPGYFQVLAFSVLWSPNSCPGGF